MRARSRDLCRRAAAQTKGGLGMEASSLTVLSPRTPEPAEAETGLEAAWGEHKAP